MMVLRLCPCCLGMWNAFLLCLFPAPLAPDHAHGPMLNGLQSSYRGRLQVILIQHTHRYNTETLYIEYIVWLVLKKTRLRWMKNQ